MSIAVCVYYLNGGKLRRILLAGAVLFSFLLSGLSLLHARFDIIPLAKFNPKLAYTDATNWFWGWREIGSFLENRHDTKIILVQSHQAAAELIYYTHETIPVCVDKKHARFSQFNIWGWPQGLEGKNGVYLIHDDQNEAGVPGHFQSVSPAEQFPVYRKNFLIRKERLGWEKRNESNSFDNSAADRRQLQHRHP